jgi:hypothetical protein
MRVSRQLVSLAEAIRPGSWHGVTPGVGSISEVLVHVAVSNFCEHMGHLVTYAPMNRIVPPWSDGRRK